MIQILHVRIAAPGTEEHHVTLVNWYNPETGDTNTATVPAMVEFLKTGRVFVCNGSDIASVEVAMTPTAHIRVKPTGSIRSLLSLPKF
jgi:hypothetical protein